MDDATTIQFELVSKSGEQMRLVFARVVNLLMSASRDPLCEIALKCGFHDQAHLTKQFRRLTGEPPAAWRRLRRRPASLAIVESTAGDIRAWSEPQNPTHPAGPA